MSAIEIDGFLSPEIEHYLHECRGRYAAWFELIQTINRFGQSLLGEVQINPTNFQQSTAGLLYLRVLCHAQGAVLLIERCMPTQAEVLCRASLEALFGLLAVVERIDTARLLIKADRHHRLDLLKATLRRHESLNADAQRQTAVTLQDVKNDLERDPSPKITTRCLAEWGGLVALYDSAYKILSLPVHSNLRDLERQLGLDKNGNPTSIGWGPTLEGLDHLLMLIAETLTRAVAAMCGLFDLGHQENLQAIRNTYAPLAASVVEAVGSDGEHTVPC